MKPWPAQHIWVESLRSAGVEDGYIRNFQTATWTDHGSHGYGILQIVEVRRVGTQGGTGGFSLVPSRGL